MGERWYDAVDFLGILGARMQAGGWLLVVIGFALLAGYAAYQAVRAMFEEAPIVVTVGISAAVFGGLVLLGVAVRDRIRETRTEHFTEN